MVTERVEVVPMSDVNFNNYHCCLLKVVCEYCPIPLKKGPITESVVFFCKHIV